MTTDSITLAVFLSPLAVLLVWELYLLAVRIWGTEKPAPRTISMIARDYGWKMSSVVYAWSGLIWHWWWPGKAYGGVFGTAAFWALAVGLVVVDFGFWREDLALYPRSVRWFRFPLLWAVVGALAAILLFPQQGEMP